MSDLIIADAKRMTDKTRIGKSTIFWFFVTSRDFRAVYLYRKRHYHSKRQHRIRAYLWKALDYLINSTSDIEEYSEIGGGLLLVHSFGIAIGEAKIGCNCTIRQNVTIGHNYKTDAQGYGGPTIGDNVRISPGAVVIGPIKIGSNVVIGANAVVINDFPNDCVVGGVPAKIIGKYDKSRFG